MKVSKIVQPLIKNNEAHYEVAWSGYRKKSHYTVEPRKQLLKDIPKMLNAYDKQKNVKFYKNGNRLRVKYDD
jgi:hypothetical protein